MRSIEDHGNIDEIETVLLKIGKSFSFVPFKAHILVRLPEIT